MIHYFANVRVQGKKLSSFFDLKKEFCLAQNWSELDLYVIYFGVKCLAVIVRDENLFFVSA